MTVPFTFYDLPKGLKTGEVIDRLQQEFTVSEHAPRFLDRRYLDTFDWRLFAAGLQLECEISGHEYTYVLQQPETQQVLATFRTQEGRTQQGIRFVWDLPDCALKKQLTPIIEMRALLPVVSLRSKLHELNILNKEEKTVLRLRIEENKLRKQSSQKNSPQKKPSPKKTTPANKSNAGVLLNRAVNVQSIRGYKKPYDAALSMLQNSLQLSPAEHDVYAQALVKSKIVPGDYTAKINIQLDAHMRADSASKKILLHLLDTLQTNETGTIDDIDSEFLHDFRVAGRRTRSALSQIKNVFPLKTTERFKREFAWLGGVTGPTRDLDVYLLTFDDYKKQVPEHLQAALEPLHEFLRKQQKLEQHKLSKTLHSARYQRLIESWRQFLESPVPARPTVANAARPILAVASERTWKMYKRVINEGLAIDDDSPPENVHELRKSCKKLRYLMEFFNSLYPEDKISKLIKALKQLQTNLGDYNDLHVQIDSLEQFSKLMMKHEHPPPETLLAMGTLIESLDQRQKAVRHEFDNRFKQFSAPEYQDLFSALFKHPVSGSDAAENAEPANTTHHP
jgi:CHAD domain-containing protein